MNGWTNVSGVGSRKIIKDRAVIHVNSKQQSTVSFKLNGVTVATIRPGQAILNNSGTADYYYSTFFTPEKIYTIVIELNSQREERTVTVNSHKQYNITSSLA